MTEASSADQPAYTDGVWRDSPMVKLDAIGEAALEEFSRVGYHATTVRTIADLCNVTVPTLYYHYKNKEAILAFLMDSAILRALELLRSAIADAEGDPAVEFFNLVECMVLYMAHSRKMFNLTVAEIRALSPAPRRRHADLRHDLEQLFVVAIAHGTEAGRFDAVSPSDTGRALVGMFQAIGLWYHPGGELSPAGLAQRYIDIAGRMVGASATDVARALAAAGA